MLKLGANKKLVKQQIQKKFGKVTTLKDIQNIQDRVKRNEQHGRKDASWHLYSALFDHASLSSEVMLVLIHSTMEEEKNKMTSPGNV